MKIHHLTRKWWLTDEVDILFMWASPTNGGALSSNELSRDLSSASVLYGVVCVIGEQQEGRVSKGTWLWRRWERKKERRRRWQWWWCSYLVVAMGKLREGEREREEGGVRWRPPIGGLEYKEKKKKEGIR